MDRGRSASWRAFHGDAALRQTVVSRLRERIDADQVRHVGKIPPVCDQVQGQYSLIGATLDGTDLERYEGSFGIPAGVAMLEEFVHFFALSDLADAQGVPYYTFRAPRNLYPVEWLEAIPPGADLQRVPPRFLHGLLLDLIDTPLPFGKVVADTIKGVVRDVAALHARSSEGDSPSADEWKAVRISAGKAVPLHKDDSASWAVVSLAEIVAWSPEELGKDLQQGLAFMVFSLRSAAIQEAYSAGQWADREAIRRAVEERRKSEPGISREALEATDEAKALRAMQRANKSIDDAQMRKLIHQLGDRYHRILMMSLASAALEGNI